MTSITDPTLADAGVLDLLNLLITDGPRTRAELASASGVSRTTLAARLDSLRSARLITSAGEASSTGGRPSLHIGFDYTAGRVGAIDLGSNHCTVAIADLHGRIIAHHRDDIRLADGPRSVLVAAADALQRLQDAERESVRGLAAVTIGIPAPIHPETKRVNNIGPMPGWSAFDTTGFLSERFATTVLVENDVNLMALGERAAAYPDTNDLMYLKAAGGIGVGLVLDGELYRGSSGLAGDIGHVPAPRGGDVPCSCGNSGCLEAFATTGAIIRELRRRDVTVESAADILHLVESGDVDVAHVLREAGRHLGDALLFCVALNNPRVVVIGGSLAYAGEHLMAGIRERVYARTIPLLTEGLTVTRSRVGADAGIVGAATLAAAHVLAPENVAALLQ